MTRKITQSDRVRRAVERQLKDAGDALGVVLELTPVEGRYLDAACQAADRAGALRAVFDAEVAAGEAANPNTLAKLSSEIRGLEAAEAAALARLSFAPDDDGAGRAAHISAVRRAANRSRTTRSGGRHGTG